MKRLLTGLLLATFASVGLAAAPSDILKSAEASMLVNGWIEVMPDGTVHGYGIDRPEKIPARVLSLIQGSVPHWTFKLINPPNAIQHTQMNLRIVLKQVDETHESIAIAGTNFDNSDVPGQNPTGKVRLPPRYPVEAIRERIDGTVYLLVQVDKQGNVAHVAAEQVNLNEYAREHEMKHYRDLLAQAAIDAAQRWTFNVPTEGPHINDPSWYVRVPVNFNLNVMNAPRQDTYGQWKGYIPGPREVIPWAPQTNGAASSGNDAIEPGKISLANQSMQLQTPLGGA